MTNSILPAASIPADIRAAGTDAVATYRAALGFEQVLLRRLTEGLASTTGAAEDSADSASSAFADMIPEALAEQIASSGGLGLARELYRSLHPTIGQSEATAPPQTERQGR